MRHSSMAVVAAAGLALVPLRSATVPPSTATSDPVLVAALGTVALADYSDVTLTMVDDVAAACESAESAGCYDPATSTIVVATNGDDGPSTTVLAHEFLHHVWVREDLAADAELVAALAELDTPGSLLNEVIDESYRDDTGQAPATEQFAYACTKLEQAQLPAVVATACGRFLDLAALPIAQEFTAENVIAAIGELRTAAGLAPMTVNDGGMRAAQARLDTFTATDQSSLGTWPEAVTSQLGSCDPVDQAVLLTDYRGLEIAVTALDESVGGALTSPARTSVGVAVHDFELIDGEIDPGDQADDVNMSVIVVMACP